MAVQAQFTFTTNSGAITITSYTGPGGAVTIPATTNGYPITGIATFAFYSVAGLNSVAISSNVTSISVNAFFACANFTTITVDPLNPVYSSTNGVLFANDQTMLVVCPSGKVGSYTIPDTVTTLADHSLYDCTKLTSVIVPQSVNNIGTYAFCYCSALTSLTIPSGVTNIGTFAFGYCPGLSGVYFKGNPTPAASYVFSGAPATVYYLPGTMGWGSTFDGQPAVLWNPQATSMGVRTNQFSFYITGTSNDVVIVEVCTNLASAVWFPFTPNTISNAPVYFGDSGWTSYRTRFYRLRSP